METYRESNGYIIWFFWIIFLCFGIYLFSFSYYPNLKELSQNQDIPEEKFGFTSDYFYKFLEKIGEAGQTIYYNFQILDYINAILLGFTLLITIRHFFVKLKLRNIYYLILLLPLAFVILDILENSLIIYLITQLPNKFFTLAKLVSDLTKVKLIFFSLTFFAVVISGLVLLIKFLYQKFSKKEAN